MKYRKTFTEAVREVWAKAAKKKEEEKPVADEKPAEKPVEAKPIEDKDATIKKLQDEIATLKLKIETEKANVLKPEPNKTTGEVPLRTGIAQAILDKKNGKVIAKKEKKEKVSVGKGQTKIEIDPETTIGQSSGGTTVDTGNLH